MGLGATFVVLVAGCGGDSGAPTERAGLPPSPLHRPSEAGRSGTEKALACELIGAREVRRALVAAGAADAGAAPGVASDSLDLTSCSWPAGVRLFVDSAPKAQLRYFNQLSEQLEYHNSDSGSGQRPVQVKGVGEDSAYGGAGAWWTPARQQLVGYAHQRIVRVRVTTGGLGDAAHRAVAEKLARMALDRLQH